MSPSFMYSSSPMVIVVAATKGTRRIAFALNNGWKNDVANRSPAKRSSTKLRAFKVCAIQHSIVEIRIGQITVAKVGFDQGRSSKRRSSQARTSSETCPHSSSSLQNKNHPSLALAKQQEDYSSVQPRQASASQNKAALAICNNTA